MNEKKTITDLPKEALQDKRVLVRADFNVPLNPDGTVASDHRIVETLPTINYLLAQGAKVILVSHLGRPKGKPDPKYSLKPVVQALQQLLPNVSVTSLQTWERDAVSQAVDSLPSGAVLLLENVRFEPGEEQNNPDFAQYLASLADVYVNDAFGTAHRAHASTEGVAHWVSVKVAGLLMARELSALNLIMKDAEKPFTAIVGGSKISSKIGVLSELLKHVTNLVIGGGMVFTFLKAKGFSVGSSLVEDEHLETALQLMHEAETMDKIIVLPKDIVVADRFAADARHQVVPVTQIPEGWMGLDLGPESTERIIEVLKNTKTVFWNGPLGVFEFPAFAESTKAVAQAIAEETKAGNIASILGGGDTQSAIDQFEINPASFSHVSTGGGATLEFLEGKALPGVAVLEDKVPCTTGA